jgi:hypothetical protein
LARALLRMTFDDRPMPRSHDEGKGERSPRQTKIGLPSPREVMHGLTARCREEGTMTVKRDLKKRVRDRQTRTGESYVTARRHVVGDVATEPEPEPRTSAVQVIEMIDETDAAARLGLRCKVSISSTLVALAEPAVVLASVRDALVGTAGDLGTALLREVALAGHAPPPRKRVTDFGGLHTFFRRARAGLGGVTDDGTLLALPVAGKAGMVPVLCSVWHRQAALLLTTFDGEFGEDSWDARYAQLRARPVPIATVPSLPPLFVVVGGTRHAIAHVPFVIGRGEAADLRLAGTGLSRTHASVSFRHGAYFLSDLASDNGVHYRGLRIDNKRIDEGDVFTLATFDLRFTYLARD